MSAASFCCKYITKHNCHSKTESVILWSETFMGVNGT